MPPIRPRDLLDEQQRDSRETPRLSKLGGVALSSPVIGPDGSVFVATFEFNEAGPSNGLVKLSGGNMPAVLGHAKIPGQVSTPAIDSAGNVFVSVFSRTRPAQVLSFNNGLGARSQFTIPGKVTSLGPPKILRLGNNDFIFVSFVGGTTEGAHAVVISDDGKTKLLDYGDCVIIESPSNTSSPGITLPPDPEAPPSAIAVDPVDPRGFVDVAVPANFCGLHGYMLNFADPNAPIIFSITGIDQDSHAFFETPAYAANGTMIVAKHTSDHATVTAYDQSGNVRWGPLELPGKPVIAAPAIDPSQTSVYVVGGTDSTGAVLINKFDLVTGDMSQTCISDVRQLGSCLRLSVFAAPAIGGQFLYVSTDLGILTFGLDIQSVPSIFALKDGKTSPALGKDGQVYVLDQSGTLFTFQGF